MDSLPLSHLGSPIVGLLGWEDSPGEGNGYPLQYSNLENSMDWIVLGVSKSQTGLSDFHFIFFFHNKRKVQWVLLYIPWSRNSHMGTGHKAGRLQARTKAPAWTGPCWDPHLRIPASEVSEDKFLLFKPQSMVLRQPVLRWMSRK